MATEPTGPKYTYTRAQVREGWLAILNERLQRTGNTGLLESVTPHVDELLAGYDIFETGEIGEMRAHLTQQSRSLPRPSKTTIALSHSLEDVETEIANGTLVQRLDPSSMAEEPAAPVSRPAGDPAAASRPPSGPAFEHLTPVKAIQSFVGRKYGRILPEDMAGAGKLPQVVDARREAMYLCHQFSVGDGDAIAKAFKKSPASIGLALKTVGARKRDNPEYAKKMDAWFHELGELFSTNQNPTLQELQMAADAGAENTVALFVARIDEPVHTAVLTPQEGDSPDIRDAKIIALRVARYFSLPEDALINGSGHRDPGDARAVAITYIRKFVPDLPSGKINQLFHKSDAYLMERATTRMEKLLRIPTAPEQLAALEAEVAKELEASRNGQTAETVSPEVIAAHIAAIGAHGEHAQDIADQRAAISAQDAVVRSNLYAAWGGLAQLCTGRGDLSVSRLLGTSDPLQLMDMGPKAFDDISAKAREGFLNHDIPADQVDAAFGRLKAAYADFRQTGTAEKIRTP
ncbi:MAG: hypothetical protein WDN72_03085 [Alphaproteobacteria bacterium]